MLRRIVELVVVSGLVFAGLAVPGFVPAASEARADEGWNSGPDGWFDPWMFW